MKTVLTIAGSDSSGGAGIQADIKTMTALGTYAMSAITALTAQNTTGVRSILTVDVQFLKDQLGAIFEDIPPDAVKIGMVASSNLIEVIVKELTAFHAKNIVVDPVMVATSGTKLISEEAIETLTTRLFPLATVITPNIPEAEILWGKSIETIDDIKYAAKEISEKFHCAVLLKGGHRLNDANDYLYDKKGSWFMGDRVDNPNTHGAGCTLSSAIAAYLAKGYSLEEAIKHSKKYLTGALKQMLNLGKGSGPMDHGYRLNVRKNQKRR